MAIKGAIIGDIIGSQYEFKRPKDFNYKTALLLTDKCNFTDEELAYFNEKAKDHSNVQIAMNQNWSTAKVSVIAKRVKKKMIRVL